MSSHVGIILGRLGIETDEYSWNEDKRFRQPDKWNHKNEIEFTPI